MHASVKRTVVGLAVVGLSAVVVPAAHAKVRHSTTAVIVGQSPLGQSNSFGDAIHGGCSLVAAEDPTIPNQYDGVIGTASVTTNPQLNPYPATVNCHVEVNGVVVSDPAGSFNGVGGVEIGTAQGTFRAKDTDVVTLCEDVLYWWDWKPQPKVCTAVDWVQVGVATDTLENLEIELVDPLVCPILVSVGQLTGGGIPGVLQINPDGDVYVADPLGLGINPVYDCPPYITY